MEDTVENNIRGLAELVIAEDEERRAQELVCLYAQLLACAFPNTLSLALGLVEHCPKARKLGFEARNGEEDG